MRERELHYKIPRAEVEKILYLKLYSHFLLGLFWPQEIGSKGKNSDNSWFLLKPFYLRTFFYLRTLHLDALRAAPDCTPGGEFLTILILTVGTFGWLKGSAWKAADT